MIIQTDNCDFNPEYIACVDRDYESGVEDVIYVHLHGAGVRLGGEHARSFLWQWNRWKALHNERFHNECQQAARR